jgi:transposase
MATLVEPGTDRLRPEAAELAKHDGAMILVCPPRRAQRKGVVEASIRYLGRSGGAPLAGAPGGARAGGARRLHDSAALRAKPNRPPSAEALALAAAHPAAVDVEIPSLADHARLVAAS